MNKSGLTLEQKRELRRQAALMYADGLPVREIAAKFKKTIGWVGSCADSFGIPRRPQGGRLPPVDYSKLVAAAQAGKGLVELMDLFGWSEKHIRSVLLDRGIKVSKPRTNRILTRDNVIAIRNSPDTQDDNWGRQFGVARQTIRDVRLGVTWKAA